MKMARAFQNGGTIPPFSFSAVNSMIKGGTFRRVVYNPREKQRGLSTPGLDFSPLISTRALVNPLYNRPLFRGDRSRKPAGLVSRKWGRGGSRN